LSIQPTPSPAEGQHVNLHQTATAAESAVVIQVGGDLYLSDSGLSALWTPQQAVAGECPYPGLDAFGPGQARWFFGREAATADLLRHLNEMSLGALGGPLLVVAPSGAGKSSLLGAGLLSALAAGQLPAPGSAAWPRVMITPGPHPKATLSAALATVAQAQTLAMDARVVLVIDQLEEIFTVCESEAERAEFLDQVGMLAADAGPGAALVVLGMRADFYARATGYPLLCRTMQDRQVVLGAMTAAEVRQAIVRPARDAGLILEAGLAEVLLHDLGVTDGSAPGGYEPGRLPLLAHALRATWERRDGNRLTIRGYEATGGIAGAIARTAEDVYGKLSPAGQAAARPMFLALVRAGAATGDDDAVADTRRRAAAAALLQQASDPQATQAAMSAFTAARLLTSGGQAVEITHEALLRRWPRLRGWIDEGRAALLTRQELEDAAASWTRKGRDTDGLWAGARLAAAQAWAEAGQHARELPQAAQDFLAASERRRRRGTRRRNAVIAVLAALSLVLAGLSVFALDQRSQAQSQRAATLVQYDHAAGGLAAAASGQAWGDFRPDMAQEFAAEADRLDPSSPQVRSAVLSAQALPIAGRLEINGAPDPGSFQSVAYNPAGTLIAGTTSRGGVRLWDVASRRLLWSHQLPKIANSAQPADHALFTPDGRTLIVAYPGALYLWNVASPAHPVSLGTIPALMNGQQAEDDQTVGLAISSDGRLLAAAAYDSANGAGAVLILSMAERRQVGVIPVTGAADHLIFTPDDRTLIIGEETGAVTLWNVATRQRYATAQAGVTGDSSGVQEAIALSQDGKTLAFAAGSIGSTTTDSPVIKLWSLATRQVSQTIKASTNGTTSVAFNPAGTQLAVASYDDTVRLWDIRLSPPQLLTTLSGHRESVTDVTFSPDSGTLASSAADGTIDLWDARGVLLGGIDTSSVAAVLSPGGRLLAVSSTKPDGSGYAVLLYSMPARKLTGVLPASGIAALAFSPDGKTLAVASLNSPGDPVQLWDVAAQRVTATFATGLQTGPNAIAFSPDGTMLAVSGIGDKTMQVWSVPRQVRLASFDAMAKSSFPASFSGVVALAFSPNSQVLFELGHDGYVRLFRAPQFTMITTFYLGIALSALAVSPDGRALALGAGNGSVYVMTVPTDPARITFDSINTFIALAASTKDIFALQFAPDNTLMASGADGVVRFWHVPRAPAVAPANPPTSTVPEQTLSTHAGAINAIAYSPSLSLLVTASAYGTRVWGTDPAAVARNFCATLKTAASPKLWTEYLGKIPYSPVCG
jgi:WD40 repeat protein